MPGRAPNGQSSIFFGNDERWHGWVSMGNKGDGRRNRRHVSGKTYGVVAAKVQALEDQREALRSRDSRPTSVSEWFEQWLNAVASNRVRARTLEGYRSMVRLHVVPSIGHIPLIELRPEHLEHLYGKLHAKGLSSSTVLRVHRVVSRALKVAVQRERISRNVAQLVDGPAQNGDHIARPLTVEQARAVLAVAACRRNSARWSVALALGLRQSEALALQWPDLDLARGTLTVRRSVHRVSGRGLIYEKPKTARSQRTIALPEQLVDALREHKTAQEIERATAGSAWEHHDLVFARPDGRPIEKTSDYDVWCSLLFAAGIEHVRLHDARHTAATLLLAAGVHPRVVMEVLGHSQMRTTTDTYSHVLPALGRDAAEKMNMTLLTEPTSEEIRPADGANESRGAP